MPPAAPIRAARVPAALAAPLFREAPGAAREVRARRVRAEGADRARRSVRFDLLKREATWATS